MILFKNILKRKSFALSLIVLMLINQSFVFASAKGSNVDYTDHWAQAYISKFLGQGVINGYPDGSFKPDNPITKAEYITFLNHVFGYTETANSDYSSEQWYEQEIKAALNQGYLVKDFTGAINADAEITRQEAAVLLSNILMKDRELPVLTNKFKDIASLSATVKTGINFLVNENIVSGFEDGTFRPNQKITRAEVATLLTKTAGELVSQKDAQVGDEVHSQVIKGNLTLTATGIKVKNTTVEGDLFITEGVGLGHIELDNVIVKGETIIRGGGENSIILINTKLGKVLVNVPFGSKVRLVSEGSTEVESTTIKSVAKIESSNSGFKTVNVEIPKDATIELIGNFEMVDMLTSFSKLDFISGKINNLNISSEAEGVNVALNKEANVSHAYVNKIATFTGEGSIETATVSVKDMNFAVKPSKIEKINAAADDTNTDAVVTAGGGASAGPTSGGGSSGGSNDDKETGNNTGGDSGHGGDNGGTDQPALLTPPVLNADSTTPTVAQDMEITFADNVTWRSKITGLMVKRSTSQEGALQASDYTLSEGKITIKFNETNRQLFNTTGSAVIITVKATGYKDAVLTQRIESTGFNHLEVTVQPPLSIVSGEQLPELAPGHVEGTSNGQIEVVLRDEFNNTVSEDNVSVIGVVMKKGSSAQWEIDGYYPQERSLNSGATRFFELIAKLKSGQTEAVTDAQFRFYIKTSGFDVKSYDGTNWPENVPYVDSRVFEIRPYAGPAIEGYYKEEKGAKEVGLGSGDTLTIVFKADTNMAGAKQGATLDQNALNALIDFNGQSFGAAYHGLWINAKTLQLVCDTAPVSTTVRNWYSAPEVDGDLIFEEHSVKDYKFKSTSGLKNADGLSDVCTLSLRSAERDFGSFGTPKAPGIKLTKEDTTLYGPHNIGIEVFNIDPNAQSIEINVGRNGDDENRFSTAYSTEFKYSVQWIKSTSTSAVLVILDPTEFGSGDEVWNHPLSSISVRQTVNGTDNNDYVARLENGIRYVNGEFEPNYFGTGYLYAPDYFITRYAGDERYTLKPYEANRDYEGQAAYQTYSLYPYWNVTVNGRIEDGFYANGDHGTPVGIIFGNGGVDSGVDYKQQAIGMTWWDLKEELRASMKGVSGYVDIRFYYNMNDAVNDSNEIQDASILLDQGMIIKMDNSYYWVH
ncbi:S-layer homology domain-containing protein [Fusibacter ferrireducens]|uniref:S-layer homology domain-containing protein n=1 Tax=Fusibacter ferrireducens TaxID=2785058 RepID=A0ABR9ZXT7_9FIRM|nr:S-layer homology domain-containing protein [Fusibacter ferrireducens]MBF4695181.1 S-layer homology domain-containing protein [Fusibacter ferrireducens]